MRRSVFAMVVMIAASATGHAAPSDDGITADALLAMKPSAIGHFLGADDKLWVAMISYPAMPFGGGLRSIELFAAPQPATANICRVEMLSVGVAPAVPGASAQNPATRYRAGARTASSAFLIADADCPRTAIRTDFMAHSGADNVFTAPLPETAAAGAQAFAAIVAAAASDNALPFALDCKGAARGCDRPRDFLAQRDSRNFESVDSCGSNCLAIHGFVYGMDWTAAIVQQGGIVTAVHVTAVFEPVI
jgi:hypothetical protein